MIYLEEDESVDFTCQLCDTPLVFGPHQEYGQPLTTNSPLIIYGLCPNCNEVYSTVYRADIEETLDMSENSYVT